MRAAQFHSAVCPQYWAATTSSIRLDKEYPNFPYRYHHKRTNVTSDRSSSGEKGVTVHICVSRRLHKGIWGVRLSHSLLSVRFGLQACHTIREFKIGAAWGERRVKDRPPQMVSEDPGQGSGLRGFLTALDRLWAQASSGAGIPRRSASFRISKRVHLVWSM